MPEVEALTPGSKVTRRQTPGSREAQTGALPVPRAATRPLSQLMSENGVRLGG